MTPRLREQVRQRAGDRCEYCLLPQACTTLPHEPDHIRSLKHRGATTLDNLCGACARCNDFKGSDVSSYDPTTNELVPLFNPRTNEWSDHFEWQGPLLTGKTKTGRATIELLRINQHERVEHRRLLMESGMLPTPIV
jgi:5-methylcytosine-specific restriction endonuclease McrA